MITNQISHYPLLHYYRIIGKNIGLLTNIPLIANIPLERLRYSTNPLAIRARPSIDHPPILKLQLQEQDSTKT
jgi:hypothetical protein